MKTPARHSLSALIAATAVLGLPAANAWAAATAAPSAATVKAKAAAAKATAGKQATAAAPVRRTIVGPTSDMRWGQVTVTIVVEGAKIVDASADMPKGKARSEYINSRVGPYLLQQLVATQSSQVELITGATMTCDSYAESLQGALDKAGIKIAGTPSAGGAGSNRTTA